MINSMGGEGKVVREWLTKQDGVEAEAEIHRKFMGSKWSKEYTHGSIWVKSNKRVRGLTNWQEKQAP